MSHLPLDVRQGRGGRRMQSHVGEDQSLLVVVLAEDLVITEVESVAHAKSAIKEIQFRYIAGTGEKISAQF